MFSLVVEVYEFKEKVRNRNNWAEGVNKRVLRSGSSWAEIQPIIEDETRSGKRKRRLLATQLKRQFSVQMRFRLDEYALFRDWFINTLAYGLYSFLFPELDSTSGTLKEYRFTKDGTPKYSNPSGDLIEVQMTWEEM